MSGFSLLFSEYQSRSALKFLFHLQFSKDSSTLSIAGHYCFRTSNQSCHPKSRLLISSADSSFLVLVGMESSEQISSGLTLISSRLILKNLILGRLWKNPGWVRMQTGHLTQGRNAQRYCQNAFYRKPGLGKIKHRLQPQTLIHGFSSSPKRTVLKGSFTGRAAYPHLP